MYRENDLNQKELSKLFEHNSLIDEVIYLDTVDSTNQYAKKLAVASKKMDRSVLVVADEQTAGRGRRGRGWVSAKGSGIWMSLLIYPDIDPEHLSSVTLVMALAVCKALRVTVEADAKIKWPNDIILGKKKVCGILTEMSTGNTETKYVIIGTGLNTNTEVFPEEIKETATSVYLNTGRVVDRKEIIRQIFLYFHEYYQKFTEYSDLRSVKAEYESLLVNINKDVKVLGSKPEYTGRAVGITDLGELIVVNEYGIVQNVCCGEVSVRGIYGYL